MRRRSGRGLNNRGFTLMEMMIVLAVIGIGLAVEVFNIQSPVDRSNGSMQAKLVRDALLKARNMARFNLKCVAVQVLPQALQLTPYDSCTAGLVGPGSSQTISFGSTVSLAPFDTGSTLTFNPQGGTTQSNPATMTVNTSAGAVFRYTVLPAIGSITTQ